MDDNAIRMMRLAGKGYTCAQIIMLMGLEDLGEGNPVLVRAMAGLAYGCGSGRGGCGALGGAACLLGLHAGKGADQEQESPALLVMLQELGDWFWENFGSQAGGMSCEELTGPQGPAQAQQKCAGMVSRTYDRVLALLEQQGLGPWAE